MSGGFIRDASHSYADQMCVCVLRYKGSDGILFFQVASTYRTSHVLSCSSSSNQSDASSPLSYQSPVSNQLEEQLGDCLESLVGWKNAYDSSGTIVNSSDTIDCAELQLVEQVIEEDEQRKTLKEPQVAPSAPTFSSTYNDQCVPVCTFENTLNSASRDRSSNFVTRSDDRFAACLNMPNANSVVSGLIDGRLVSVYNTTKQNAGGCAFVNPAVDDQASSRTQRYYEQSAARNARLVESRHNDVTLYGGALNGEGGSSRITAAIEQSLCASQQEDALRHNISDGMARCNQSSTLMPNDYQIPTPVSNRSQR